MKVFILLALSLTFMTSIFHAQAPPIEPGVSETLARWRAANYSDVRYKLNLTIEKGAPLVRGTIEISVNLTAEGAKNNLILDWRATQFQNDKDQPFARVTQVNGAAISNSNESIYSIASEHLQIGKEVLKPGANTVKIEFASPIKTSGSAVTRYVDKEDGAEYVYSLFVPSDASSAFPVFDQPDLKAKFTLQITTPKDWSAVSNTSGFGYVKENESALAIYSFPETKPISTYVFAFAAGNFEVFEDKSAQIVEENAKTFDNNAESNNKDSPNTRRVRKEKTVRRVYSHAILPKIYVRKSQAEKFKQHSAEVFRLNREAVRFLESYFDYKYPFPKYDLVLIPEFPFGGMEHAGATFLRESSIIFPTEPTKNDFVSRANLIFHEAAHQWFGDTVTMRWFDDLWLKEGFAEFMAYKTLEKVLPEAGAWKIFYERNKQAAYATDSTKGTTPIYQEILNLSAAKSAYGNIVYRKAPSFLKQAEFYLGEQEFQKAVRSFLKKYEFKNAEWQNLVKEFERSSKLDLKNWAETWVKKAGVPIFRFKYGGMIFAMTTNGCMTSTELNAVQKSSLENDAIWQMRSNILLKYEVFSIQNSEELREENQSITKALLGEGVSNAGQSVRVDGYIDDESKLKLIFPNYQDYGYGIFLLDEKSRAYVLENIQTEEDDFLRAMMWGSLWDSVREAELAPADYLRLVVKNINVERDESTIQTILSRVLTAMNYYLSDAERAEFAAPLENLLIEKMRRAVTPGQRITFYRGFLNAASSENARNVLKQILNGEFSERGENSNAGANAKTSTGANAGEKSASPLPPLKTKDKFDIVTRLLILNDKDAAQLLAELEKTETSDEAKRYAYAARAGVATAENKAKLYADFTENKELSESYIEAAFAPFNSVRHADLTLPYLKRALAELPNLKRTRKIFFVNGWLAAFIGGQKSAEALKIVNQFLDANPALDRDLRLKILENADNLERAAKIRATHSKLKF